MAARADNAPGAPFRFAQTRSATMSALESTFEALAVESEPAEAPTLLDTLARAPAAAALVVAARSARR